MSNSCHRQADSDILADTAEAHTHTGHELCGLAPSPLGTMGHLSNAGTEDGSGAQSAASS